MLSSIALGSSLALLFTGSPRCRPLRACDAWNQRISDSVVRELDTVPVFALHLQEDGTLFGSEESGTMVYTQLSDANRVLGQLMATYPDMNVALKPLGLGAVLRQCGMLDGSGSSGAVKVTLVASPTEKREAKRVGDSSAARARRFLGVPLFHVGELSSTAAMHRDDAAGHDAHAAADQLWPLLFRVADVESMWDEVGGGQPMPALRTVDLAEAVEQLRLHAAGTAPGVARPLLCGAPSLCAPFPPSFCASGFSAAPYLRARG